MSSSDDSPVIIASGRIGLKTPMGFGQASDHEDTVANDGLILDQADEDPSLLVFDEFSDALSEANHAAFSSLRNSQMLLRASGTAPVLGQVFSQLARASGSANLRASTLPEVSSVLESLISDAVDAGHSSQVDSMLSLQDQLSHLPHKMGKSSEEIMILAPPKPSLRNSLRSSINALPPAMENFNFHSVKVSEIPSSSSSSSSSSSFASSSQTVSVECPICFDLYSPDVMHSFSTCGAHLYCAPCLSAHLLSLITSGEIHQISCPSPGCTASPLEDDIQQFVGPDVFEKYLRFMVLAVLKDIPTLWCPNPSCGGPCLNTEATCDDRGECPNCGFLFCIACMQPLHPGVSCDGKQLDASVSEWLQAKGSLVKPCFSCKEMVEKNSGCNHISCRCGAQWCWLCSMHYVYGHFNAGFCGGFQFVEANTWLEAKVQNSASTTYQQVQNRATEELMPIRQQRMTENNTALNAELSGINAWMQSVRSSYLTLAPQPNGSVRKTFDNAGYKQAGRDRQASIRQRFLALEQAIHDEYIQARERRIAELTNADPSLDAQRYEDEWVQVQDLVRKTNQQELDNRAEQERLARTQLEEQERQERIQREEQERQERERQEAIQREEQERQERTQREQQERRERIERGEEQDYDRMIAEARARHRTPSSSSSSSSSNRNNRRRWIPLLLFGGGSS